MQPTAARFEPADLQTNSMPPVMNPWPGPVLGRRAFLGSLSAALPAITLLPRNVRAAEPEAKLPPIRALTRGPKFHWRGYYDKLLFDPRQRFVLANEVDFEGRSPRPDDVLGVGMIDTQDGDRWIELGTSRAWNWQQGCMLQWLPGSESSVAWNDRDGDHFICHVLDVKSGAKRTLPHPFYCLSPDGRWGLAPDFRRLNDTYPDTKRCQNPHLFHIPSGRFEPLGHFHQSPEYQGEWRCDTHPCASPDGTKVLIDSPHGGNGRQVYLIDIGGIIGR